MRKLYILDATVESQVIFINFSYKVSILMKGRFLTRETFWTRGEGEGIPSKHGKHPGNASWSSKISVCCLPFSHTIQ